MDDGNNVPWSLSGGFLSTGFDLTVVLSDSAKRIDCEANVGMVTKQWVLRCQYIAAKEPPSGHERSTRNSQDRYVCRGQKVLEIADEVLGILEIFEEVF